MTKLTFRECQSIAIEAVDSASIFPIRDPLPPLTAEEIIRFAQRCVMIGLDLAKVSETPRKRKGEK